MQTIRSLASQVDEIFVSLNGYTSIPEELVDYENVKCVISENIGDRAKFAFVDDFDGIYITCDDDIVYPKYYINSLKYYLKKYDYKVGVGWHGAVLKDNFSDYYNANSRRVLTFSSLQSKERFVHILGTGCLAFHTKYARPEMSLFEKPNMADVYFAIYAQNIGLPLVFVPHMAKQAVEVVSEGVPIRWRECP